MGSRSSGADRRLLRRGGVYIILTLFSIPTPLDRHSHVDVCNLLCRGLGFDLSDIHHFRDFEEGEGWGLGHGRDSRCRDGGDLA